MKTCPVFLKALAGILVFSCLGLHPAVADEYEEQRIKLLTEVIKDVEDMEHVLGRSELTREVLSALEDVPRHEFVPEKARPYAYRNRPLSIEHGQTISQPLIVAIMTDLLDIKPGDRVFELGTGSGYQAAILADMDAEVYSMEIIEPLAESADQRLNRLGYDVRVRVGDGYHGWEEQAPFDAIIVTAAGDHIPLPLVKQLKPGGRMILPVGGRFFTQQLILVTKESGGTIQTQDILPVSFVPLTGDH
ncbi:protein-L-isoaspartate(D-aspartate) O-methyltransferase [Solemya velesiana gill symbiont]|uniref:Protein-L-isoaspartate O-methyltransferase n=1 Tax=Solemya velesiana gill symbiont TaxID=1918948 RepID=A0A1T2KRF3_9GAMM|nr:protein-L-isoaspartate(D-aspartate) O-methyltransferase [Solemya velesiana gill symbiont]OOZ35381.1 protein-L-isoaspartate O-methyltransferase [Solemya velesiana gill symbiont]